MRNSLVIGVGVDALAVSIPPILLELWCRAEADLSLAEELDLMLEKIPNFFFRSEAESELTLLNDSLSTEVIFVTSLTTQNPPLPMTFPTSNSVTWRVSWLWKQKAGPQNQFTYRVHQTVADSFRFQRQIFWNASRYHQPFRGLPRATLKRMHSWNRPTWFWSRVTEHCFVSHKSWIKTQKNDNFKWRWSLSCFLFAFSSLWRDQTAWLVVVTAIWYVMSWSSGGETETVKLHSGTKNPSVSILISSNPWRNTLFVLKNIRKPAAGAAIDRGSRRSRPASNRSLFRRMSWRIGFSTLATRAATLHSSASLDRELPSL